MVRSLGSDFHRDVYLIFPPCRHKLIDNDNDRGALKAFLHPNSLVNENNPLRKEGVPGLELYNGEYLPFSARRSEYEYRFMNAACY